MVKSKQDDTTIDAAFRALCASEVSARETLVLGFAADIASLSALSRAFLSVERMKSGRDTAASRCTEYITGRASILARARLKSYANALIAAECPIARALAETVPSRQLPRIFHVRVDGEIRFSPSIEAGAASVDYLQRISAYIVEQTARRILLLRDRALSLGQERLRIVHARLVSTGLLLK